MRDSSLARGDGVRSRDDVGDDRMASLDTTKSVRVIGCRFRNEFDRDRAGEDMAGEGVRDMPGDCGDALDGKEESTETGVLQRDITGDAGDDKSELSGDFIN